jgi:hypothetical protein
LHDGAELQLQAACTTQPSRSVLEKLAGCVSARRSCQCGAAAAGKGDCPARAAALRARYTGAEGKVCQSLLGCWVAALQGGGGDAVDVPQLVEAQLAVVQPALTRLTAPMSAGSRRRSRSLLQTTASLSDPVLDDRSGGGSAGVVAPLTPDDIIFESGSLSGGSKPASTASSGASRGGTNTPQFGMNGVILSDEDAPKPTGSPVENPRNVRAPILSGGSGGAGSGMNPGYTPEAGSGVWGYEGATPTVDPDAVFGSSGGAAGHTGAGDSASPNAGSVVPSGGSAPAGFWRCAGEAAVKADTTRKWADVDYNSGSVTLGTWLNVLQPAVRPFSCAM